MTEGLTLPRCLQFSLGQVRCFCTGRSAGRGMLAGLYKLVSRWLVFNLIEVCALQAMAAPKLQTPAFSGRGA